jgi:hypothetical protein
VKWQIGRLLYSQSLSRHCIIIVRTRDYRQFLTMSAKQFQKGPTVTLIRTIRPKGLPSVYCNNSCCIYKRECVVTSFYSSIVRLVGSYYLSDRSPNPPPPSSPRWWLHLHTRTSSTVVKTFGVNIQEEIVGGRPRYSVHLLMSYTAPFVKIFESNLFPADQARLQNVVQISL